MPAQYTILLVDDEADIADVLARAAEHSFPEASFIHVTSYVEAAAYLDDLEGRGPQLILLDVNLRTGQSGFEFLSLLRQHPQGYLVPVIVLSASRSDDMAKEAYNRGANAFTTKPFSYADWKAYVKQLREYWFKTATIPKLWFVKATEN